MTNLDRRGRFLSIETGISLEIVGVSGQKVPFCISARAVTLVCRQGESSTQTAIPVIAATNQSPEQWVRLVIHGVLDRWSSPSPHVGDLLWQL